MSQSHWYFSVVIKAWRIKSRRQSTLCLRNTQIRYKNSRQRMLVCIKDWLSTMSIIKHVFVTSKVLKSGVWKWVYKRIPEPTTIPRSVFSSDVFDYAVECGVLKEGCRRELFPGWHLWKMVEPTHGSSHTFVCGGEEMYSSWKWFDRNGTLVLWISYVFGVF